MSILIHDPQTRLKHLNALSGKNAKQIAFLFYPDYTYALLKKTFPRVGLRITHIQLNMHTFTP